MKERNYQKHISCYDVIIFFTYFIICKLSILKQHSITYSILLFLFIFVTLRIISKSSFILRIPKNIRIKDFRKFNHGENYFRFKKKKKGNRNRRDRKIIKFISRIYPNIFLQFDRACDLKLWFDVPFYFLLLFNTRYPDQIDFSNFYTFYDSIFTEKKFSV